MKILFVASILLWPLTSWSGFESGKALLQLCAEPRAACLAYLMGVVDGADAMAWESAIKGFCVPDKVNAVDVRQIVLEYAGNNPKLMQLPGGLLVLDALKQAWSCARR